MHKISITSIAVLLVIFSILVMACIVLLTQQHRQHSSNMVISKTETVSILFQQFTRDITEYNFKRITGIIDGDRQIPQAVINGDRQVLLQYITPVLISFQKVNPWLNSMTFIQPDGTIFLRVHQPELFGDTLSPEKNAAIFRNINTRESVTGFSVCSDILSFRIAVPIIMDNTFIGNIVVGIAPEYFMEKINRLMSIGSCLLLDRDVGEKINKTGRNGYIVKGDMILYPGDDDFFRQQGELLDFDKDIQVVSWQGQKMMVVLGLKLNSVSGRGLGKIFISIDVTEIMAAQRLILFKMVGLFIFIFMVAAIVLYYTFSLFFRKITLLNQVLEKKNRELLVHEEQLEKIVVKRTDDLQEEVNRRKNSEETLQVSLAEWRRTFDAIQDVILILDLERKVIKKNKAAELVFEKENIQEQLEIYCCQLLSDEKHCSSPCRSSCPAVNGAERTVEREIAGKTFQVICQPIIMEDRLMGFVSTARDITKMRKLEKKLVHAQKLEAIATLASGIAHDFNNILAAILGNTDLLIYRLAGNKQTGDGLRPQPPTQEEIVECLIVIKRAGVRAEELVGQILTFSRQQNSRKREIDIAPVIKEGGKLLRASLPATITINVNVAQSLDKIFADPGQIHQILMNLASNSAQSIGRDKVGEINIELAQTVIDDNECRKISGLFDISPGRFIVLTVSDTGHGIVGKEFDRIFDPFYTTREKEVGTGMGLAVIHGIVASHHGAVVVESILGQGTTIRVLFPCSGGEPEAQSVVVNNMPTGTETVLFVDDEEDIVKMGCQMLTYLGYKVFSAKNGEEALDTIHRENGLVDLLITDQTMPGLTGLSLAKQVHQQYPEIKIILCSGYSEAVTPAELELAGISRFLSKPLAIRLLAESIRKLFF